MSYVGDPFKHDLFVSYSHGDVDGTGESKLKQWSQAFARELEGELKAFPGLGGDISIFLDEHLRPQQALNPMESLTDQLRSEIEHSAVLSVLMSPQYIASKWCREERQLWHEAQDTLGIPTDGRTALAQVWPTPLPWPPEFCDHHGEPLVGFTFYDKARAELRPQPYEWPEPKPDSSGPFRDELLDLVGRVRLKLDEVKAKLDEQRRQKSEAARLTAVGGQVVYLHGRTSHVHIWEQTCQVLEALGLVVFPSEPDPIEQDPARQQEIRRRRVEIMSGCDGLLLIGTEDARAMDADLAVVARQDRHSARAISNHLLPCALLDNAGLLDSTSRRRATASALQVDWIDATHETWPSAVQRWIGEAGKWLDGVAR